MTKIFSTNFQKGSLLSNTNILGNNSGAVFRSSEKGKCLYFNSASELNGYGSITGVKTIVIWLKPTNNSKLLLDNGTDKLEITGSNYSGTGLTENYVNNSNTDIAMFCQWQCVISEFSAGIDFNTDFEIDVTDNTYISRIELYDETLTSTKRDKLYEDFLYSYSLYQDKVKPIYYLDTYLIDLSNNTEIIAAYNSNILNLQDKVWKDVTQNSFNGDIFGALFEEDGVSFGGDGAFIGLPSSIRDYFTVNNNICLHLVFNTRDSSTSQCIFSSTKASNDRFVVNIESNLIKIGFLSGSFKGVQSETILNNKEYILSYYYNASTEQGVGYLNNVLMTGTSNPANIAASTNTYIGKLTNSNIPFNGKIKDFRLCNTLLSNDDVSSYYNLYAKEILLYDNLSYDNADGSNQDIKLSDESHIDSGTFKILEDSIGKYIECVTDGSFYYIVNLDNKVGNGYIKKLTGDINADEGDTVDNATNLSYSNNKLSISMTNGQAFRELLITNQEEV